MPTENGKLQIILAVIGAVGVLGAAIMGNWGEIFSPSHAEQQGVASSSAVSEAPKVEMVEKSKFESLQAAHNRAQEKIKTLESQLTLQQEGNLKLENTIRALNDTIEELEIPFHRISDTKLKQLIKFHNATKCYGRSLNLIHDSGEEYAHCESKEDLAKKLLMFFEELELIHTHSSDYSRSRAKKALIQLQGDYKFNKPGWYNDLMLGILIIEYAKKA
ncbi:hypothetical protein J4H24_15425 [Vibrio alginolyticus]|jgi:hypothetical protein|uniref:hypothetical protein n=1 Tax=Vibrio alginolyticus TaxID=663 RepID=UPI001BD60D45|nr:hypothetical protein [Vibrio alginolyticus]EGQ9099375.1 hypothetical protein [Vibrio alginolyticus]MBT0029760.1 hypothetical protein [Vibrio alginolyticus]MBT0053655.1 hypothetical protein [Vibrio alginolyticus]